MKHIIFAVIFLFLFSCGKDKIVLLPDINNANISEINDVSAAYLFYDESNSDGIELNRKNLISTTNWLVNVDKRLTLKQVIPQIKFLQEKRRNAQMHKNEKAKNYYTCNDTSIKNLGFIEFTNVVYNLESSETYMSKIPELKNATPLSFNLNDNISIINPNIEPNIIMTNKDEFINFLKQSDTTDVTVFLNFNENLLFQDYISYKSILSKSNFKFLKISNLEFLYN